MFKLNVENYDVVDARGNTVEYDVKSSLKSILFAPAQQHDALSLIEMSKVVDKLDKSDKDLLLEDSEMDKVRHAFKQFRGLGQAETELAKRIIESDKVEVKEK